ncbi:hypothetical protein HUG17_2771 [Dermatophagoides farinae]|uniref:Pre-C2HC domain-containing protein n=1 Tax=Dermatophagoides farinae TaxID=6954 RepID=A0A9D4SEH9_DERFA|nr:hypothetical protein HUG17_2771 [Dermatophagoides farinae]
MSRAPMMHLLYHSTSQRPAIESVPSSTDPVQPSSTNPIITINFEIIAADISIIPFITQIEINVKANHFGNKLSSRNHQFSFRTRKVAIDFTSPESQQKFEDKVAATPELVHETPRILYPMMIIKGAPARIEKEQLPNMIKTFNHLICEFINKNNLKTEQEIEPVYARQNRKPGLRNFAIRVNPKLRDIIVDKMHNKIIIDYQTTHIEDMTPVMQCYKCYGYNHKISECQVPDQMCLHCGDFHSFNQCTRKSSPAVCLNCIRSNITNATSHNSVNRECPVHIRLLSRVINKIQY